MGGGLESVYIETSIDGGFDDGEAMGTSINEHDLEPEQGESFHVKSKYNPALFENGFVRPRLA